MLDRREEILKTSVHGGAVRNGEVHCEISEAKNAMDVYMKECCLEILVYVNEKTITSDIDEFGQLQFQLKEGGHWITKEQLFENFL